MAWVKSDNGLKIADSADIETEVRAAFTAAFPGLNTDPSTPQGQLITSITGFLTQAQSDVAAFGNIFQQGGSGVWLDARNNGLYGLTRKPSVNGSVTATIYGLVGSVVPAGFKASDDEGHIFITNSTHSINANGQVNAEMIAEKDGDFQLGTGSLVNILTPVYGVERITNEFISVQGQPAEADAQYRKRAQESIFFSASAIFAGMLARLSQITGVERVGGHENDTKTIITWKGAELQPNSVYAIVKGGDIVTIGQTMLQVKNPGCYTGGNVASDVYEPISGQVYTMRFSRPTTAHLQCSVQVKIGANVAQNYADIIKEQLGAYIAAQRFGAEIYPFQMSAAADIANLEVTDFKIGRLGSTISYNIIELGFLEEASLLPENITVTVYG